jgi:hypothetical protein
MLKLTRPFTFSQFDLNDISITVTNQHIILEVDDARAYLDQASAGELSAALIVALDVHGSFARMLPYLETVAGPVGPVLENMAQYLPTEIPHEIDSRLLSPCPVCGAGPGRPCVDPDDSLIGFGEIHSEREDAD